MLYHAWNHSFFEPCPSSRVRNTIRTQRFGDRSRNPFSDTSLRKTFS